MLKTVLTRRSVPTAITHSGAHLLANLCRKCIKFFNYCVEALLSIANYIRIFIGLECLEARARTVDTALSEGGDYRINICSRLVDVFWNTKIRSVELRRVRRVPVSCHGTKMLYSNFCGTQSKGPFTNDFSREGEGGV